MRALLRENINVYTATMEDNNQEDITNPRVAEMQYFENLFETEKTDVRMNYSQPVPGIVDNPDKSAYLYWVDGTPGMEAADKAVGPSIALRVNAGDKFDIETWARFENKISYTGFDLATLASLLGNTFASIQGFEGYSVVETSQSLLGAFNAVGLSNGTDNTIPYAYLNYVVYDKDMVPIAGDRVRVPEDAGFESGGEGTPNNRSHKRLSFNAPVEIAQDGYIYIWVSNQSEATKAWFDDLKVTHKQYIVTQATDYGVWGDVLREQKSDETKYRFGYQGQYAEKDEETGWNHFELREYDPVIGRWTSVDPKRLDFSPYIGMYNNPVSGTDPDGGGVLDDYEEQADGSLKLIRTTDDDFNRVYHLDGSVGNYNKDGTLINKWLAEIVVRPDYAGEARDFQRFAGYGMDAVMWSLSIAGMETFLLPETGAASAYQPTIYTMEAVEAMIATGKSGVATVDELIVMMNARAGVTAQYATGDALEYLIANEARASHMMMQNGESDILLRPDATRWDVMHEWLHRSLQSSKGGMTPGEDAFIEGFLGKHQDYFRIDPQ